MKSEKDLLSQIKEDWNNDSKMNIDELHHEALKIPMLHSKYLNKYSIIKQLKIDKEAQRKVLKLKLYTYYAGKGTVEDRPANQRKITGSENLIRYMEADEEMVNLNKQIDYLNLVLDYITDILKMIHNRSFQIKHAIDYQKFVSGLDI